MKRLLTTILFIVFVLNVLAQNTAGIKGTIVDRNSRDAIAQAKVILLEGDKEVARLVTDGRGVFEFLNLPNARYIVRIEAANYLMNHLYVLINDGSVKNMFQVSMAPLVVHAEGVEHEDNNEFDIDDAGYSDAPTILFGGNDMFSKIAGFGFSSVRFKQRGYKSEAQDVYLAGIKMNDTYTGFGPFSLWSGLNEAFRAKEEVLGTEVADFAFGGYNGSANFMPSASNMRTGTRFSVLTNSAFYRLRLMASHASGLNDKGWAWGFNVSARLGGNDWVKGAFYRSFAYHFSVDKVFNDKHKLSLVLFATPGNRGTQNGSTQEVYDLMKDNMYNSNWGYHNGRIRNSRERITHEPISILKYEYTPTENFMASVAAVYRFGKNGYTALDWYDAPDPRPDYYRNLPSYFWNENEDLLKNDRFKYENAVDAWTQNFPGVQHVNWNRLQWVNENHIVGGKKRSKYVLEERRADQQDFNLVATMEYKPRVHWTIRAGWDAKANRTEFYKKLHDLLGGEYYENLDQFAERDFSFDEYKQNDLDYYLNNREAQKLKVGDKYGYDYYGNFYKTAAWLNTAYDTKRFSASLAAKVEYSTMWRTGLVRKGTFAGLDPNGNDIFINDGKTRLTRYDSQGNVITSLGNSKKLRFLDYAVKANLSYIFGAGSRIYTNVAYFTEAPRFNQVFVSPRTRNSTIINPNSSNTFTTDFNYQYVANGCNIRLTAFYTLINEQTNVRSYYDDTRRAFANFALRGINQRHAGIELGYKIPTPVKDLYIQGAVSYGDYIYTSNPYLSITVDNDARETQEVLVPYWMSHPTFAKDNDGNYVKDTSGNYQQKGSVKHYVDGTPQLATSIGLNYFYKYWFFDLSLDYFGKSYLSMNPFYRTDEIVAGPDAIITPQEVEYFAGQEKLGNVFMLNASIGKSWFIKYKYQLGFNISMRNMLNNRAIKTGGFEQSRVIKKTKNNERYYKFDSKYFYAPGMNYMINVYFKF